ncbi:hypothetical protein L1281_001068 [Neisseria sp. HSC-16F19]|nr:hypothetical protein [Neisseria sp. HSC-16F19]MCP2040485.1 hypothetical protein [Neisseria sp. HSC-16F19]
MLSCHCTTLRPALLCLALLATPAAATVGGDDYLEVLGYEAAGNKVYLLRHYEDGLGGSNLYYFNLSAQEPERLIKVLSFYDPASKENPNDQHARAVEDAVFEAKLAQLKKRLRPLSALKTEAITLHLDSQSLRHIPSWGDPQQSVQVTDQRYHLSYGPYQSAPATASVYKGMLTVKQAYRLPKQQGYIASVRYTNTDFETGYSTEEMHLLKK